MSFLYQYEGTGTRVCVHSCTSTNVTKIQKYKNIYMWPHIIYIYLRI